MILTRRIDQGVHMYDEQGRYVGQVVVLGVERDRVKLGFKVDSRFIVLREELLTKESA